MTEIEKQEIKEMVNIMGKATKTNLCHKECFIDTDFDNECSLCRSATALFNAGYRKIDGDTSDGYHTYNELYHHRAVLFTMICNQNKEIAWKSKKHSDGTMFDNMFIVGIDTPRGQATYHYDILPYWDYFKVKELETAPIWDGHTPSQAIDRILEMSKEAASYRKQSETVKEFAEMLKSEMKGLTTVIKEIDKIAAEFGKEE